MTAPVRLTMLFAVVCLFGAACASSTPYATVDGIEISSDDVFAHGAIDTEADGVTSTAAEGVRQSLTELIFDAAATSAAATDFDVVVTDEDVAERLIDPPERWAGLMTQLTSDPGVTETRAESVARRTLLLDGVGPQLLLEAYGSWEAVLAESPELVAEVCVRHIVVATEEEAEAALARIEGGESFEDVAAEVSLDTTSPGGLINAEACPSHVGQVGPEFGAAMVALPLDEVGGPVQTEFGYHLIRVEDRVVPTAEELAADPIEHLELGAVSDYFTPWFSDVAREADVDVASAVGRWSPEAIAIAPPGT